MPITFYTYGTNLYHQQQVPCRPFLFDAAKVLAFIFIFVSLTGMWQHFQVILIFISVVSNKVVCVSMPWFTVCASFLCKLTIHFFWTSLPKAICKQYDHGSGFLGTAEY